jgi:hypothetical protein
MSVFSIGKQPTANFIPYLTLFGFEVATTGVGLHEDHHQVVLQITDIGTAPVREGRPSLCNRLKIYMDVYIYIYIKQNEIKMYKNGIKVGTSEKLINEIKGKNYG